MKTILVVGHKGNMGRRYCAILDRLGVDWIGIDLGDPYPTTHFDGAIIATPTASHSADLAQIIKYSVPVLCEKPISKDLGAVTAHLNLFAAKSTPLAMVNQYAFMHGIKLDSGNFTNYNYFKTGGDGLAWDCLNITGLALGDVSLKNDSPIWQCNINGRRLKIEQMDRAYIEMIADWIENPVGDPEYITEAHRRADEFNKVIKQGFDRYPSAIN